MGKAVFLDRDGVLIKDVDFVTHRNQVQVLPSVADALKIFEALGLKMIVVTNQAAVARGIASEKAIQEINAHLSDLLFEISKVRIHRFYYCPHHPNADLGSYRVDCACRKPKPGMLVNAARDYSLSLSESYMIGDRPSDIAAGNAAGCRSIWLQSGRHEDPMIDSSVKKPNTTPHHTCKNLMDAATWVQKMERINSV